MLPYLNLLFHLSYEVTAIDTSCVVKFKLPLQPSQHAVRLTCEYILTGITNWSEKLPDAHGAFVGLDAADGSAYDHPRSSRAEV